MAMSKRREARFEVVVEQGGKPNIDGVFDDEKAATERANFLLRLAKFPVVRVVKVTGTGREETIFQKTSSGMSSTCVQTSGSSCRARQSDGRYSSSIAVT